MAYCDDCANLAIYETKLDVHKECIFFTTINVDRVKSCNMKRERDQATILRDKLLSNRQIKYTDHKSLKNHSLTTDGDKHGRK